MTDNMAKPNRETIRSARSEKPTPISPGFPKGPFDADNMIAEGASANVNETLALRVNCVIE